ncbi:MAG: tetratricopeptide repeat protein [Arenimonas sp.]
MKRYSVFVAAFGGAILCTSPIVLASGSGGGATSGGNYPSESVPRYDPAEEYKKGVEALQAENYKEADRSFGRVLQAVPRDANSNFMAGLARSGLGKLKDARRYFEKAVKYNDDLILAHRELGIVYAKLGEAAKAKAVLDDLKQRAVTCGETCPQAAELKGAVSVVEAALGAPSALQVVPARSEFLFTSAERGDTAYLEAVALINEKRYDEAIAALNNAASAFGPHPDILTYLGFVNRKQGRLQVAEDYYRRALAAAPDHLGATEYYGELMVERGDLAGARQMLSKLESVCRYGCAEAEELRRWITVASSPDS